MCVRVHVNVCECASECVCACACGGGEVEAAGGRKKTAICGGEESLPDKNT